MPTQPRPAAERASIDALIAAGALFHQRGWVPATAGNFSVRVDARSLLVTTSGRHKGELTPADFLHVDLQGRPLREKRGQTPGKEKPGSERGFPTGKSSAETLLHCQIYRRTKGIGAVLHTHSPASTVLSRRCDNVRLEGYELLKIFDGIKTHETAVEVPVYENDQDIARLAAGVEASMNAGRAQHAYLIRGHGLYTWGRTVDEARHRVEALEFLFECEMRALAATGG